MAKITEKVLDCAEIFVITTLVVIIVTANKANNILRSFRLKKITKIEILENAVLFKKGKKILFSLKKSDKYAVGFSENIITFGYFGCALEGECHEFRMSRKNIKKLKGVITLATSLYEGGMYRYV